jgi:predicted RNase H-like nuclease (RuvC/YqgF family)
VVKLKVFGIDVEPGCMGRRRCFTVVVVEDGKPIAKYEHVPLHKLVRLAWEFRPKLIAVDNVYELADSEKEIARLVSLLPEDTDIVQVTVMDDGTPVDLRVLASSAGLDVQGKLSPSRTAYILAVLAEKGYGVRVRFLEEKTKIIVSRSRSPGKGGSSSLRYQRNLRAGILRAVRDIKKLLDRNRLDYDLVFRKSGGGLDSAVFIVYASRDRLYGLVKPHDDGVVRIEIKPIYSSHMVLEKHSRSGEPKKLLIVGIDPGHVTGIAALDLSGSIVFVTSRRGVDRQEVVEMIRSYGLPLVVASDVKPAPDFVKKLASMLGAQLYEPPEPLSVDEKRELVSRYASGLKLDSHERDALAAAIKAYNYYSDKVKQIESVLSRYGLDLSLERIVASVIKGVTISEAVEREIARLLYAEEEPGLVLRKVRHGTRSEQSSQRPEELVARLKEEIERLRAENTLLRKRVEELQSALEEKERDYKLLKAEVNLAVEAERRVQQLKHEVDMLRRELERVREENAKLKEMVENLSRTVLELASGKYLPAPLLRTVSREAIKKLERTRPRIVVTLQPPTSPAEAARLLANLGVKVLVALKADTDLAATMSTYGILVVEGGSVVKELVNDLALIDAEALSLKLAESGVEMLKPRSEDSLTVEKLKEILKQYRIQRLNEILGAEELEDSELTLNEHPS